VCMENVGRGVLVVNEEEEKARIEPLYADHCI